VRMTCAHLRAFLIAVFLIVLSGITNAFYHGNHPSRGDMWVNMTFEGCAQAPASAARRSC
jgi:hypothetical protein